VVTLTKDPGVPPLRINHFPTPSAELAIEGLVPFADETLVLTMKLAGSANESIEVLASEAEKLIGLSVKVVVPARVTLFRAVP
jgi:hypothetical protein